MRTRGAGGGDPRSAVVAAGAPAVRRLRRPHNLRYVQVPASVRGMPASPAAHARRSGLPAALLNRSPPGLPLPSDGLLAHRRWSALTV